MEDLLETVKADTVKQDPEGAKSQSGLLGPGAGAGLINSNIIPDIFTFGWETSGLNEEIKPSRKLVTNNRPDRKSLNQTKTPGNIHHLGDTKYAKIVSSEFFSHLSKQSRDSKVDKRHNLLN